MQATDTRQTVTFSTDTASLEKLLRAIERDPARRAAWRRLWAALLAPTDKNNMIEPPQPSGGN